MTESDDQDAPRSPRAREENVEAATAVIERVGEGLSLPRRTIDTATALYRQLLRDDNGVFGGRTIESMAAAAVYVAAKVTREPRNVSDFEAAADVSETELLRCSKEIVAALDLGIDPFVDVGPFVERYGQALDLPTSIVDRATEIVEVCEGAGTASGKNPRGWAAAALYCAAVESDHRVTQEELAAVADVTTLTIRNRYQEQRDALREREPVPTDPYAVVDWYLQRLSVATRVRSRARDLLACVSGAGAAIEDGADRWGAAALRRASVDYGDPIGMKALKKPIDAEACQIKTRVQEIREALRSSDDYPYLPPHRS